MNTVDIVNIIQYLTLEDLISFSRTNKFIRGACEEDREGRLKKHREVIKIMRHNSEEFKKIKEHILKIGKKFEFIHVMSWNDKLLDVNFYTDSFEELCEKLPTIPINRKLNVIVAKYNKHDYNNNRSKTYFEINTCV